MLFGNTQTREVENVAQTTADAAQVLSLAMDLGKSMIRCGAEINRVEETIMRICAAYGCEKAEVFSVVSVIVATVFMPGAQPQTQSRRVYTYSTNFERLDRLNTLSRRICEQKPSPELALAELAQINADRKKLRASVCVGYILAASSFTLFFGGNWKDALAAAPIAALIWLCLSLIRSQGMSKLFFTFLSCAAAGFLAIFCVKLHLADHADMIMIGDIMVIVPGLLLINSLREMLCGDLMSGLLRMLESLILSLAIACGFAIPLLILK